jgi:hypothetical protein
VTSERDFVRRSNDRRVRMAGLVRLFQAKEIPARKFRHLTALLKAEHRADARESGITRCRELE